MNWQQEHERILDEMNRIAGERVFDLETTLAKIKDPAVRKQLRRLNALNDHAVRMYYKEN